MSTSLTASIWGIRTNTQKPSIFELILTEQLSQAFRPAFDFFVGITGRRFATVGRWIGYRDEVFAVLMLFVQNHFIQNYSASLGEYLYGLKRVDVGESKRPSTLKSTAPVDAKVALFCLVAVPYIVRKAEDYFEEERIAIQSIEESSDERRLSATTTRPTTLSRRLLLWKIYRVIQSSSLFANVWFKLMYSIGRSEYVSPLLAYAQTSLRRITSDDVRRYKERLAASTLRLEGNLFSRPRLWIHWGFRKFLSTVQTALLVSAVAFKFVEWWHSADNADARERAIRRGRLGAGARDLPPPSPVSSLQPLRGRPSDGRCALCRQRRKNPTISTSGAIFCYACLFRYVDDHGKCPATGLPCTTSDIRRLR